jgi:hypothetical protein
MVEHFVDVRLTVVITAPKKHNILPATNRSVVEGLGSLSVFLQLQTVECAPWRERHVVDKPS